MFFSLGDDVAWYLAMIHVQREEKESLRPIEYTKCSKTVSRISRKM